MKICDHDHDEIVFKESINRNCPLCTMQDSLEELKTIIQDKDEQIEELRKDIQAQE